MSEGLAKPEPGRLNIAEYVSEAHTRFPKIMEALRQSELEDAAQTIFDQTPPTRDGDGQPLTIPFARWRDDTKACFLALAARDTSPTQPNS